MPPPENEVQANRAIPAPPGTEQSQDKEQLLIGRHPSLVKVTNDAFLLSDMLAYQLCVDFMNVMGWGEQIVAVTPSAMPSSEQTSKQCHM